MEFVDELLRDAVAAGDAPGVVAVATDASDTVYLGAAGRRDPHGGAAIETDAIFRIASMTKPITSVAAMQLVERGLLSLDEPIGNLLPALASAPVLAGYEESGAPILRPARRRITLRHLLTHTSGLGYTTWNRDLFEFRRRHPALRPVAGPDLRQSVPLIFDPGERWAYSTSTDWVGFAIEAVTGTRLGDHLGEHVFEPLGMRDTRFELPASSAGRAVATQRRRPDGSFEPVAPDSLPAPDYHSGGGGLYSTASDYVRFLRALLASESASRESGALLAPATMAEMCRNQIGDLVAGSMRSYEPERSNDVAFFPGAAPKWGLGWLVNTRPVTGGRAAGSLAWGGLYNCYFWVDRSSGVAGAIFTSLLPFCDRRVLDLFECFEHATYAHAVAA